MKDRGIRNINIKKQTEEENLGKESYEIDKMKRERKLILNLLKPVFSHN